MGRFCPDDNPRTYREPETTAFAPDGKCWKRFKARWVAPPANASGGHQPRSQPCVLN